jgi:hypothetical protein
MLRLSADIGLCMCASQGRFLTAKLSLHLNRLLNSQLVLDWFQLLKLRLTNLERKALNSRLQSKKQLLQQQNQHHSSSTKHEFTNVTQHDIMIVNHDDPES